MVNKDEYTRSGLQSGMIYAFSANFASCWTTHAVGWRAVTHFLISTQITRPAHDLRPARNLPPGLERGVFCALGGLYIARARRSTWPNRLTVAVKPWVCLHTVTGLHNIIILERLSFVWLGGAVVRELDSFRSTGCRFWSRPPRITAETLGKSFTPLSPSSIIWYRQKSEVMLRAIERQSHSHQRQ